MEFMNEKRQGWLAEQARKLYKVFRWRWLFNLGWKPLVAGEKLKMGDVVYMGQDGKIYRSYSELASDIDGMNISDDGTIAISSGVISLGIVNGYPVYAGVLIDKDSPQSPEQRLITAMGDGKYYDGQYLISCVEEDDDTES